MSGESFTFLIDDCAGMFYCDELERAIAAVEDNDVFFDYRGPWSANFASYMVIGHIAPQAFRTLRDTLIRNGEGYSSDELEDVLNNVFGGETLRYAARFGTVATLRVLAEIIPHFADMVLNIGEISPKGHTDEQALVFDIWDTEMFDGFVATPDFLEKIDFLVEQCGTDVLNSSLGNGTVFRMIDDGTNDYMYWGPYLAKWISIDPRLLNDESLDRYRNDLTRFMLDNEANLGYSTANILDKEARETSLASVITSVIGDQSRLLNRRTR